MQTAPGGIAEPQGSVYVSIWPVDLSTILNETPFAFTGFIVRSNRCVRTIKFSQSSSTTCPDLLPAATSVRLGVVATAIALNAPEKSTFAALMRSPLGSDQTSTAPFSEPETNVAFNPVASATTRELALTDRSVLLSARELILIVPSAYPVATAAPCCTTSIETSSPPVSNWLASSPCGNLQEHIFPPREAEMSKSPMIAR
jgi:hypothetical protein